MNKLKNTLLPVSPDLFNINTASGDIQPVCIGLNKPILNISSSQRTGRLYARIKIIRCESETTLQKFSILVLLEPVFNFFESHHWIRLAKISKTPSDMQLKKLNYSTRFSKEIFCLEMHIVKTFIQRFFPRTW